MEKPTFVSKAPERGPAMHAFDASALIKGSPPKGPSKLPGKARHPRSRAERELLDELKTSLDRGIEIGSAPDKYDEMLSEAAAIAARSQPLYVMHEPATASLSSNGGRAPSLFYTPPPMAGVGLQHRGTPFAGAAPPGLTSEEDAVLKHYGVQHLSDYARASLLGEMAQYIPPHRQGMTPRAQLDRLLSRVQQHQLARTVQNEYAHSQPFHFIILALTFARSHVSVCRLRAKQPDAMWQFNENNYHLAPVTGSSRVVPVDAWASYIRGGGDPAAAGVRMEIMKTHRAELAQPWK